MRVAVTGARGFIGSALEPALKHRGHEVRGLSRDTIWTAESYSGCEAVVHLANVAHTAAGEALLERVNVEGTRRAAELAAARGVKRFVYISSIRVSGDHTAARPFDGFENPAPQDAYGRAKLAAERTLGEVSARTGMQAIVLRPPLVYGPRVKAKFLLLMRAIARGWPLPFAAIRNRRSLIYVGNLADAIACCVEAPQAPASTLLVSDGQAVSTPELCRALGRALGRPARLFPLPVGALELLPAMKPLTRSLEVDDGLIRREFGWRAPVPFDAGLSMTAEWYRLECAA
jgi:nucleoside-diphosphate-sugar epimerase